MFSPIVLAILVAAAAPGESRSDVVIYGATPAGVTAAIQAARLGKSVVLLEPGRHVGGLTSGGLGRTDIGNKAAIGGIAREFYQRVHRHYEDAAAWKQETREKYVARAKGFIDADTMWGFEPHVAEEILRAMLTEAGITPVFQERLDLKRGVRKEGTRIVSITTESGNVYSAKVFIDATYEGDLMARAGVHYAIGREANSQYEETLNGVQTRHAVKHQFIFPVDPFVVPGNRKSGLLPGLHDGGPGIDG
jgi:flavin-dependent dehydrogenase